MSVGPDEPTRLSAINRYEILGTPAEDAFDRLTRLAARLFDVPYALISFVDRHRQWNKSCFGLDIREIARSHSFCDHTINAGATLVVEDARLDQRFTSNPLVANGHHVRFYAGAPLRTTDGHGLGSISIMDTRPRSLSDEDRAQLTDLADLVMAELELRRRTDRYYDDDTARARDEREAERALQRSEEKFRNIFEFAAIGIVLTDLEDGKLVECNGAFERMLGYTRDELVDLRFVELTHPEDRAKCNLMFSEMVGGIRHRFDCEKRYVHRDGSIVWARVMVSPVHDSDGHPIHALATIEDITPYKEALAAQRESEERFRAVTEQALDVIAVLDEEASVLYVSPSVEHVLGLSPEEMTGRSSLLRVHHEDRPRVRAAISESLRRPQTPVEIVYRMQHMDGTWRHFALRGKNLLDNPSICGLLVNIRDVTEQTQIEAALRDSRESYRGLFERVNDGIVVLDGDGRVLDVNQGMLRQYGYKREELIGRIPILLSAPDRNDFDDLERRLERAFHGVSQSFEWWGRRKDGQVFPAEIYFSAGTYFGHQVVIATARDITERIAYEKGLIEARNEAEEMVRLKSAFLANMSHEIRTPLTTILGFTEVLAEEVDEPQREFVDLIRKGGRRLQETLMSVLDLARLEARSFSLQPERLDVNEQVRGICQLFEPLATEKSLWIRPSVPDEPVWALLDEVALNRVLGNLIGNAIKFSDNGGVHVSVTSDTEYVRIVVRDTGIGIGTGFMPHLFEAFKQESEGLARAHEGSGLGLSISRHLVELMQGNIMVESEKGKGTTFSVTLPKAAGEEESGLGSGTKQEAPPSVLVIEDNVDTRTLLRYLLGPEYTVTYAATGEEAVELATTSRFDALLVDINLGQGKSGEDVFSELRARPGYEAAPFIALTAYAMPGDRERFLDLGFSEYLSKPFTKKDLMEKLRRALDGE